VIVICLLLEAYHRDVIEGLICKCSFEDFITVDVNVKCQCNKSRVWQKWGKWRNCSCVSNNWLSACIFHVVDCDLCCGIFLYNMCLYHRPSWPDIMHLWSL